MKNTIKKRRDFDFSDIESSVFPAFFAKTRPRRFDSGQYGLVASKKVFPTAVRRNRAKRLLREWIRAAGLPPEIDALFIARAKILETNFHDGLKQIRRAVRPAKTDAAPKTTIETTDTAPKTTVETTDAAPKATIETTDAAPKTTVETTDAASKS